MRVIARKERAHPGAQLRITDIDGHRATAFATNTNRGQLADLELRQRRRARREDRIRAAKTPADQLAATRLAQNPIWCAIVALGVERTAWLQVLALAGRQARRWEPKPPATMPVATAARFALHRRSQRLHLAAHAPWSHLLASMINQPEPAASARLITAKPSRPTRPDKGTDAHPSDLGPNRDRKSVV